MKTYQAIFELKDESRTVFVRAGNVNEALSKLQLDQTCANSLRDQGAEIVAISLFKNTHIIP